MRASSVVLLAVGLLVSGCQVLAGYEDFKGPSGSSAAGTGGSGGDPAGGSGGGPGGTSGAGGDSGAGGGAPQGACEGKTPPTTTGGPPLVAAEIGDLDLGTGQITSKSCAWVDQTEVTSDQYEAFLKASGVSPESPLGTVTQTNTSCKENLDLQPDQACVDGTGGDPKPRVGGSLPVVCVDACDAEAFCRWAGKQLCDGSTQQSRTRNPMFMACSSGNTFTFPYGNLSGNTYQADRCNDSGNNEVDCPDGSCALLVASSGGCTTSAGVADLVGNAAEWTGDCGGSGCNVRGGSYLSDATESQCDHVKIYDRLERRPDVGFRCCKIGD
jgi:sulfatase modifying factor 1